MWQRLALMLGLCGMLAACSGDDAKWHTTDIGGLMPPLQFNLIDGDGQPVTADAYHGKVTLLFFGYTHCPDVCPLTLSHLAAAIQDMDKAARKQVQVLFVSVDPQRDTPQLLQQYAGAFGPQFIGLTGTQTQLQAVTKRYRSTYGYGKPDASGNYEVSHSSAVYVFDPAGKVQLLLRDDDKPDAVAQDLDRLAKEVTG